MREAGAGAPPPLLLGLQLSLKKIEIGSNKGKQIACLHESAGKQPQASKQGRDGASRIRDEENDYKGPAGAGGGKKGRRRRRDVGREVADTRPIVGA